MLKTDKKLNKLFLQLLKINGCDEFVLEFCEQAAMAFIINDNGKIIHIDEPSYQYNQIVDFHDLLISKKNIYYLSYDYNDNLEEIPIPDDDDDDDSDFISKDVIEEIRLYFALSVKDIEALLKKAINNSLQTNTIRQKIALRENKIRQLLEEIKLLKNTK